MQNAKAMICTPYINNTRKAVPFRSGWLLTPPTMVSESVGGLINRCPGKGPMYTLTGSLPEPGMMHSSIIFSLV